MSEPSDDILTRPLGIDAPKPSRLAVLRPYVRYVAPGLGGVAVLGIGLLTLTGDPHGGEPRAVAMIAVRESAPQARAGAPAAAAEAQPDAPAAPPSLQSSAGDVERASGVTVTRPAGTAAPEEAVIIRVPAPDSTRLAAAPDPRLTERGRHGVMPRLGEGRLRALDAYARPDDGSGSARIAILVSGIGTGQAATAAAIARLPPAISLALSPYAADLEKTAARARDAGHEILLQAPMEPFDYPDSDPGPQTLLTSSRPAENFDRLAWAMSRFPGFVGLVNFMGGKLLSDQASLEPILKEIGGRGLGFVDDGASQGSKAAASALKLKVPAARAEIVLDAMARPEAIDRELARLEAQAKKNGFALASASAQQLSIDRIARWARDLEARGIRLVPVSAALRGQPRAAKVSVADH
ncbi:MULTISPECIES: divergent polysaccharide deacetylase family protein [Methylobacterium]|uniref:divergent polysaccharide deacetylase family protein n=1 Tax=Methylobacterium TaxID=407 RepID=UPI0011C97C35|nr:MULTISPECIES: divergent polysaccharide deacetylase family protein [Methylobacterium]TXN24173.1 divergent polysaccharide deacetylase family protein [Methylobacterium sp. WL9]